VKGKPSTVHVPDKHWQTQLKALLPTPAADWPACVTNHVCVGEATRLDDLQKVSRVVDVPTGDAADALETVHDVSVHAERVARLRDSRVVRLQQQRDSIQT